MADRTGAGTQIRLLHAIGTVATIVSLVGVSCTFQQPAGPEVKPSSAPTQFRQELIPPTTAKESDRPFNNLKHQVTNGQLPLSFEANRGQTDPQVRFLSRGKGYSLFLTSTEAVLALRNAAEARGAGLEAIGEDGAKQTEEANVAVLRMRLEGAHPSPRVSGLEPLPGKANYFVGNDPKKWQTNVPTYAKVKYEQVYPGIDLIYYGQQRQLEYDLVVAPGADPGAIKLAFEGADQLEVDAHGDLVLHVAGGELRLRKPVVYQERDGLHQQVPGHYVLAGQRQVSFQVAAYDASRPLIIDPVLKYSTYLGGIGSDAGYGIALDSTGNAYVTGWTGSTNFPTANAAQPTLSGYSDVFVTKFDPTGSVLVYSTYLGGSAGEVGHGLVVDAAGNAHVAGWTGSTDFPTARPWQPAMNWTPGTCCSGDAFVAKLNADGTALLFSTYLGGSTGDIAHAIAVDSRGVIFVTGVTGSSDFPTANALQPAYGGGCCSDAFLAKLDPAGPTLLYSTYLGGGATDTARGLALDASGNAYVTGDTASRDFPTANPLQPEIGGQTFFKSTDGGAQWIPAYQGLGNSLVNSLAIDPTIPSTLYIGADQGLFKSTNGGTNWTALRPGASSVMIAPSSPLTVYSGTGRELLMSVDGGATWTAKNLPAGTSTAALAVDPTNSCILYAGTTPYNSFFKSTDCGDTWLQTTQNFTYVLRFVVAPTNPPVIYAGTANGVFISRDGGVTWSDGPGGGSEFVLALTVAPSNPSVAYAGLSVLQVPDCCFGGGAYKTTDGGSTWVSLGFGKTSVRGMAVDPVDPNIVYASVSTSPCDYPWQCQGRAGAGLYKSLDGGTNWTLISAPGPQLFTVFTGLGAQGIAYAGAPSSGPDAFVAKVNPDGTALAYSTFLGGKYSDLGYGIAVDTAGNAYVSGSTMSPDFPTVNPLQPAMGGSQDAFVAKLNPTGSALVYSTYLGGSGYENNYFSSDAATGIGVDSAGNAYVTGSTSSSDFPTANSMQPANGGGQDAFVAKLNSVGSALVYSTYLGGQFADEGHGIAVDPFGDAYVVGITASDDFPTANPFQSALAGYPDAFVAKIVEDTEPPTVTMTAPANGAIVTGIITVSADASDNVVVAGAQFYVDGAPLGAEDTTAPYAATWDTSGTIVGIHKLTAVARDAAGNSSTSTPVTVTVANVVPSLPRLP